jgi:hypothetical protein
LASAFPGAQGQVRDAGDLGAASREAPTRGAPLALSHERTDADEPTPEMLRKSQVRVQPEARPQMADNWTHDRPFRAPETRTKRRRHVVEQPRLELPLPEPRAHTQEAEAQPVGPQRGIAEIDFYV